jgi:AraC-like DNA-binding protein
VGFKDMIARCIARLRQDQCATCENHDRCVLHKAGAFAPPAQRRGPAGLVGDLAAALAARLDGRSAFVRDVERHMERLLERGDVAADRIARDMGISRQTLYRRLRSDGVTFEQMLDRLRHRLALHYLRQERLPVKAVSYRLGFSDPAAFSRAFKRWTGSPPRVVAAAAAGG